MTNIHIIYKEVVVVSGNGNNGYFCIKVVAGKKGCVLSLTLDEVYNYCVFLLWVVFRKCVGGI